jgi:hypothetical protein
VLAREEGKILHVARRTRQPAGNDGLREPASLRGRGDYAIDSPLAQLLGPYDAALTEQLTPDLELGLDQHQQSALGRGDSDDRVQHGGQGDEREVGDHEVDRPPYLPKIQIAHVRLFPDPDSWIIAERGGELAGADVDRDDLGGTTLEQHLGEATGRGAGVQRPAGHLKIEIVERAGQLVSAAGDIAIDNDLDQVRRLDPLGRPGHHVVVNSDQTGIDHVLSVAPGADQPAVHELAVQALTAVGPSGHRSGARRRIRLREPYAALRAHGRDDHDARSTALHRAPPGRPAHRRYPPHR